MSTPSYEGLEPVDRKQALAALDGEDDALFNRAFRAAAMYLSMADLDQVIVAASGRVTNATRAWGVSEAISTCTQARQIVPTHAEQVLVNLAFADVEPYAASHEEALALVRRSAEHDAR